jgi:hypothetical protein
MNGKKKPIVRINPYDDIDSWVNAFNNAIEAVVHPQRETCMAYSQFCDWRLSYGVLNTESSIYFLAFYPPFCTTQKALYHYRNLAQLAKDVLILENFLVGVDRSRNTEVDAQDVIAAAFAVLRGKDSIELFQEQKELMEFGLIHYHLDNYYQDLVQDLVSEYQRSGTLMGRKFHISLFDVTHVTFKVADNE